KERVAQESLELRGKRNRAVRQPAVVEGLYPQPVAREKQAAARAIVESKGKHAVETRQAVRAPLPPSANDDLGVSAGTEAVTKILKLGAQLAEIIDFAIVGEDRKCTRLNSSHVKISYAVFCLKKK